MTRGEAEGWRPLRADSEIGDVDLALGARLLQQVGPVARSEQRKRRVWQALSAAAAPRFGLRLRTLHLAFAGLLFAAASSATVGYYASQGDAQGAGAPDPAAVAPRERQLRPARAPVAATPLPGPQQAEAPPAALPPAALPSRARAETSAAVKAAPNEAEAELLVEAMRARREGDPKRVSQLVDEYRAKHPQGALQEEALILAIESAASRRAPNTVTLAREYLARFPSGRFALQARRALSLDSP